MSRLQSACDTAWAAMDVAVAILIPIILVVLTAAAVGLALLIWRSFAYDIAATKKETERN